MTGFCLHTLARALTQLNLEANQVYAVLTAKILTLSLPDIGVLMDRMVDMDS